LYGCKKDLKSFPSWAQAFGCETSQMERGRLAALVLLWLLLPSLCDCSTYAIPKEGEQQQPLHIAPVFPIGNILKA